MHFNIKLLEGIIEFDGDERELQSLLPLFHEIGNTLKNIRDNPENAPIDKIKEFEMLLVKRLDSLQDDTEEDFIQPEKKVLETKPKKQYIFLLQEIKNLLKKEDLLEIQLPLLFYFFKKIFPNSIPNNENMNKLARVVSLKYEPDESSLKYLIKRRWLKVDQEGNITISGIGQQMLESILKEEFDQAKSLVDKKMQNANWA